MPHRHRRGSRLPLLAAGLLAVLACVPLRPFAEVRSSAGPGAYVEVDGHLVHTEVRGRGEPVLLVHGFGGSTYSWRLLAPRLATGYRTVAVDLYGFGYSERPRERAAYNRAGQVGLLLGVLDALGLESAHFIGHSYGGGLVLTLAHRHPQRVRSLVLLDSTAPDYALRRRGVAARLPPLGWLFVRTLALRPAFVRRGLRRSYAAADLATPEVVAEYLARLRVEGAARAYRGLADPAPAPGEGEAVRFEEIGQPALVIWGADDRLISAESARQATRGLPRGRFVVLPECGHSPMEEQPEEVAALVEAFLAEVEAAGPRAAPRPPVGGPPVCGPSPAAGAGAAAAAGVTRAAAGPPAG